MALKRKERFCVTCGKSYFFCPHCDDDANKPRWMFLFHDENCKNLDHITSDYWANEISKDEAKELYDECDLSNRNNLHPSIVKALNEVYGEVKQEEETEVERRISKLLKK